ncbi:hypothetical protein PFICI_09038 [Pestalotiopsis fici W106-1]|uniref:Uncharacterized protein n=1 Tax=Pestalotiopsis fici (strain W106-1 / CGMCC3.15140) TaxID=1229662 RepID=W3WZA5_PESFW|nr:uncharacterized protein PFICI_09038 [Pestalotiopsis fici W106-1]ETS79185.1 hypothetical protein PFICI_09038 [Pestalotiopsis fici W106-1]
MPPIERDAPVDWHLRHKHSASTSDQGRALIPMWDSSDPERAPAPLPLNPQSPSTSRASPAIQSAHAALNEKARENAPALMPPLTKRMTDGSPERALVSRPSPHKRTQTLQPSSVRDLGFLLEGPPRRDSVSSIGTSRSPEKSGRPSTPVRGRENEKEKSIDGENAPSPMSNSLTPVMRSSTRKAPLGILGENTPPQSATMLALQNMPPPASSREATPSIEIPKPLSNVTNNSTGILKTQLPVESLSHQILTLTNIATALQKEMALLSRRSRDNATDLMSLKEATHARDEDIRKSLREIIINADHRRDGFRGGLYIEDKPHGSPPSKHARPFSLPRIPSPTSFAVTMDQDSTISSSTMSSVPSLVGDSPATLALLEKIIREMGTKDGQENAVERLTELAERLTGLASSAKVEELIGELKSTSQQLALVPAGGGRGGGNNTRGRHLSFDDDDDDRSHRDMNWSHGGSSPVSQRINAFIQDRDGRRASLPSNRAGEIVNEEVIKVIRGVKDSVAASGGLTSEVKALVRELRGEVLGMGREIGRRIDEVNATVAAGGVIAPADTNEPATKNQMEKIVIEGLDQMRSRMTQLLKDHRRESAESTTAPIDYQEIYNAMKAALNDSQELFSREDELSRDDVLQAVRDAWETYKPEIHVEQLGLERDEVLAVLKQGLEEFAPPETPQGASRDEVFLAVVEGLKQFKPPQVDTPASLSRDEVLEAVRECLEEFEFPVAPSALGNDVSKEDMLEAVKQGLESFEFPDFSNAIVPHAGSVDNSEVIERLQDIMQVIKDEFKAVSAEAKQNVAANGRDTEQVLDATKDGFEELRAHMESYIDRLNGTGSHDDLAQTLAESLNGFQTEISEIVAQASDGSKAMLQEEIESLRDAVNSSLVPHTPQGSDNREVLEALREGLERVRLELLRPHAGTTEVLDAMHEGFGELRATVERIADKPTDLTANDEVLDALRSGLDNLRADIESLREQHRDEIEALREQNKNGIESLREQNQSNLDALRENNGSQIEKAVAPVSGTVSDAVIPADMLKQDDIKNLEVMLTQLRIKVEAMEPSAQADHDHLSKSDIAEMEELLRNNPSKEDLTEVQELIRANLVKPDLSEMEALLRNVQESVAGLAQKDAPKEGADDEEKTPKNLEDAATKEDVEAIETILRNTKARLDDLIDGEQAIRKDHVDTVEALVLETKESLSLLTLHLESVSKKDDINAVESLVTQIIAAFDEMKERAEKSLEDPERVTKTDVDAVEAACLDIKSVIDEVLKPDIAALPTKDDIKGLEEVVREAKVVLDSQVEANEKAFEERQAEIVGVSERVTEVKAFFEEFQTLVKEKLENETSGLEALSKVLEALSSTMDKNATVSDDLKEMFEVMKVEFEDSKNGVAGAKIDNDEKLQATTDTLGAKIDEKIGELIAKYDAFELVMEERHKSGEARDVETEAAVVSTKAVADELKLLIDTLGSTVTESMEKMEEASKTVFTRVDELFTKSEENHSDDKNEHSITRDQVKAAVTAVEGLQGHVVEYQPKILESIKDVLLIVGQHYEHSKTTTTEMQKSIEDVKEKEPELPQLPPVEKYDDTEMHAKLDKLVDHSHAAGKAYAQLDTLDKVHAQVVQTAAEINSFLEAQTKRIEEEREDHEKAQEEAAKKLSETNISLAVAQAEKEHVEANVGALRTEEEELRESILALRTEQEFLARQKTRLTADVSSLETAMQIRREELHAMEARAEGLERRILEGVLDHSRALLMTKSGAKGRDAMSRKRVPTSKSNLAPNHELSPPAPPPTSHRKAVNIAVNGNRASLIPPNPAGASRRILSLSQITNNVPTGGLKRSQSVRTPAAPIGVRKGSWGAGIGKKYGDLGGDKENEPIDSVREDEEPSELDVQPDSTPRQMPLQIEAAPEPEEETDNEIEDLAAVTPPESEESGGDEDNASDSGTLRRSSLGSLGTTVITSTETETADGDSDYDSESYDSRSEWTESALGTESMADTESLVDSTVGTGGELVLHAA